MSAANPYLNPRLYHFDYLGLVTGRRLIEATLARELPPRAEARVLDIGCGSAPWKPLLAPYAREYVGIDLKPGPAVDVVAPAEALPFPDGHADVVFSISVLEHVRGQREAVSEIRRVLKPGGVAIVGVPFIWPIHGSPHDYWRWTPHGLEQVFAAFASCRVEQAGGWFSNYLQVQNVFYRDRQEAWPALRGLWSPIILCNNVLGRLFGGSTGGFTGMATFYLAVARA